MVSKSPDAIPGKMFIGGLSMNSTSESMRVYFLKYGEISDCVLMMDKTTGKSRGFGFVTFKNPTDVEKVLAQKHHVLDGKTIDCKEAIPQSHNPNDSSHLTATIKTKKIFVGGLPHSLTEDEFSLYFSKFGTVVQCQIMKEWESGKPRGFGFVTFDSEEAVEQVMSKLKEHKLHDKWVECKKATPSNKPETPKKSTPSYRGASGKEAKYGGYSYGSPSMQNYYYQQPGSTMGPQKLFNPFEYDPGFASGRPYYASGVPYPSFPGYENYGSEGGFYSNPGYYPYPYESMQYPPATMAKTETAEYSYPKASSQVQFAPGPSYSNILQENSLMSKDTGVEISSTSLEMGKITDYGSVFSSALGFYQPYQKEDEGEIADPRGSENSEE